eukprot:2580923-Pleurochrysis_carterae.AAC.4
MTGLCITYGGWRQLLTARSVDTVSCCLKPKPRSWLPRTLQLKSSTCAACSDGSQRAGSDAHVSGQLRRCGAIQETLIVQEAPPRRPPRLESACLCGPRKHRGAQERQRRERRGRYHQVAARKCASQVPQNLSQCVSTARLPSGGAALQPLSDQHPLAQARQYRSQKSFEVTRDISDISDVCVVDSSPLENQNADT